MFNRDFWVQALTDPDSDAAAHSYATLMKSTPKTMVSRTQTGDPGWNGVIVNDDITGADGPRPAGNPSL